MYTHMTNIYIYIYRERERECVRAYVVCVCVCVYVYIYIYIYIMQRCTRRGALCVHNSSCSLSAPPDRVLRSMCWELGIDHHACTTTRLN